MWIFIASDCCQYFMSDSGTLEGSSNFNRAEGIINSGVNC